MRNRLPRSALFFFCSHLYHLSSDILKLVCKTDAVHGENASENFCRQLVLWFRDIGLFVCRCPKIHYNVSLFANSTVPLLLSPRFLFLFSSHIRYTNVYIVHMHTWSEFFFKSLTRLCTKKITGDAPGTPSGARYTITTPPLFSFLAKKKIHPPLYFFFEQ